MADTPTAPTPSPGAAGPGAATPGQPATEDTAATEQVNLREARLGDGAPKAGHDAVDASGLDIQLSEHLRALRDHLVAAFPQLEVLGFRGELTLLATPGDLVELAGFCRDDPDVACEFLMDVSGVHWPGGEFSDQAHETTGWPTLTSRREGHIEVDYLLYSLTHNHRFRIRVDTPDTAPSLPTVSHLYGSANFMEREAFDFFGITFVGHPNLQRIHMPDGWEGHPQRKDYPLGGVEVQYKGATVPPPDERKY